MKVSEKIAEDLAAMVPDLTQELVDAIVDRDKKRRVEALVVVYDRWSKLQHELRKASKPDQVTVDPSSGKESAAFTKKAFEAKKTIEDKIGKLERAIEKALDKGDFNDLYNIARDKEQGGGKAPEGDNTSSD